ncbi:glutathionylspermidine synthase family protein [Flavobacterium covae]|uniref:glutathionylspermidine synthase family protein n=1 Tax=Flavobacterium covae TaxID=2906076 RepID=UPI000745E02C|nr:glutathionylspermidine synthase family protein [Flavobacterium covae]AMA48772.1 glutathionylspermidine synthase [Flavobacterium covae]MCJ1807993.1 glutathionylspermidine synthase family protein [Flavobacterium covae]
MNRITITPRVDWRNKVEELGFNFHSIGDKYWDESVFYEFSIDEITRIEKATAQLWEMCLHAVEYVIENDLFHKFHIPNWFIPHIKKTWENEDPSIYGRFDFCYKKGKLKLLEFNADTPTSLFEASIVQWFWLQECYPYCDQFNSIHEKLIAYWEYVKPYLKGSKLHFTSVPDSLEDITTVRYLQDCAMQVGLDTYYTSIDQLGWDTDNQIFVDDKNNSIASIFKLYPYEWMINETFGKNIILDKNETFWIEPSWKMLLSNKALLPILWRLYPDHEFLLASYFDSPENLTSWCEKPILSREGSNIKLIKEGDLLAMTGGEYGEEGFIYQELAELPDFYNNYPLIGSWIIGQEPAGIGIRESKSLITDNTSHFVPHLIRT